MPSLSGFNRFSVVLPSCLLFRNPNYNTCKMKTFQIHNIHRSLIYTINTVSQYRIYRRYLASHCIYIVTGSYLGVGFAESESVCGSPSGRLSLGQYLLRINLILNLYLLLFTIISKHKQILDSFTRKVTV